ncbi:MAG: hypothetical protein IMW97_02130 [Firmicutes bacterium]|nr:hypothetical protein [Candidatus Fermentithermobacillaceae bacterium]
MAKGSISRATLHRHLHALGLGGEPRYVCANSLLAAFVEQKELIDQKLLLRMIQDLNGN